MTMRTTVSRRSVHGVSIETQGDGGPGNASHDGAPPPAESPTEQAPAPTWLEWSVRAVSVAVVLALLAYLALGSVGASSPAVLISTFDLTNVETRDGQWVVPVSVRNEGDTSVASAVVSLTVLDGDVVIDSEDVDIALLGGGASTDVEFWVDDDPRTFQVRVDVGSYELP